jgi:putative membrane protein
VKSLIRVVAVATVVLGVLAVSEGPAVAAPSDQDQTWMVAAHQGNLAEIAAGSSAQTRATTADVKSLGAMFVQMHTQLDAALTAAAQQLGVALPASPTADQQAQLAQVEAKTGQDYDTAWIAQHLAAHSTSLAATNREVSNGSDPTVVGLARTATPVISSHLTQLRSAGAKYGVPSSVPGGTGGQAAAEPATSTAGTLLTGLGLLLLVGSLALFVRRRRHP